MKLTLESWLGIMILIMMFAVGVGFTSINMNVVNARKVYQEYIDLIEETDGAVLSSAKTLGIDVIHETNDKDTWIIAYNCGDNIFNKFDKFDKNELNVEHANAKNSSIKYNGKTVTLDRNKDSKQPVHYYLIVTKTTDTESNRQGQTFIYNNIYKVQLVYTYDVMLFGRQTYKIGGLSI